MLEKRLTWGMRIGWMLATAMGLGFLGLFSYVAATAPPEFPLLGRLGFVAGALFGLGWTILALSILKRGAISLKSHSGAATGMVWGFVLLMMIIFLQLGMTMEDGVKGIQMILSGLVFLVIFGIPALIMRRVETAELALGEHLLKLELQLAEISEKLGTEPKG